MKTNKKFLTILTLCIALLLTACGTTDAAGTDKTNESLTETGTVSTDSSNTALNDLYQQENQIFADHEAVWNKVFGMMSKSNADPSANYADYLADTVEANKDSFTEDELKTLTEDRRTDRRTGTGNYHSRSYCSGKQFRSCLSLPEFLRSGF